MRLCKDEEDIKSFAYCCKMMHDSLGSWEPQMYLFTSLKIFLSLLNEFSFEISDPLSVLKAAENFAVLERESRERVFDDPREEHLFRRFTEEKLSELHKKFDLSKAQRYHYSIIHITPTIASALGVPFETDLSLYNKPIGHKVSDSVGISFKNAILIFIDGLGLKQLQYFNSAIDPKENTLRTLTEKGILVPLKSVFPTETFCCLYSIFNALSPNEHKVIGKQFMMQDGPNLVEIDLGEDVSPLAVEVKNFFKACADKGFKIGFFSQNEDRSGFVRNLLLKKVPSKQKDFVYKPRLGELFKSAATFIYNCLKDQQKFVLQIFIDEADMKWHDDGPFNKRVIEEINDKLRILLRFLRTTDIPSTLVTVFSDHGLVHISQTCVFPKMIVQEDYGAKGKMVSSGLRLGYIYFEPAKRGKVKEVAKKVVRDLGKDCAMVVKQESEWRGHETFPDILIYPYKNDMFTIKEPKDPMSMIFQHFGVHGACSFDEMFAILMLFSTNSLPDIEL